MRSKFDEQLQLLNRELITMGAQCENAIALAVKALLEGDAALAAGVPELSAHIDRKEREIENRCLRLLLQQQPVARDLRSISSALKMITDMERIGCQAADIAEIVATASLSPPNEALRLREMALAAIHMVTDSIDAFVKKDVAIAAAVIAYDDVVDDYFTTVKRSLTELLRQPQSDGEYALDLLMIAKYLERIGDHAVNIAEWVLFSISGQRKGEKP